MSQKTFEVWMEGFAITGNSAKASKLGEVKGDNFRHACEKWARKNWSGDPLWDPARQTYWGCRLFDNEADARASFG